MAARMNQFEGEDLLRKMGATWFVSYAYHNHIDKSQMNWNKVRTTKMRITYYVKSKQYHREWLEQILAMNDKSLATNTIGLTPSETKKMAKELLNRSF